MSIPPGLEPYARTATVLRPRSGTPSVHDSHIGGPMLWPAGEPWPLCEEPHMVFHETLLPSRDVSFGKLRKQFYFFTGTSSKPEGTFATHYDPTPHEPNPLVGVAQLFARDVPDLVCPPGTDMLQVLWCPNEHELDDGWSPYTVLRWRDSASVTEILKDPPAPDDVNDDAMLMPEPCTLHPERVTEYPWWEELPEGLRELAEEDDDYDDEAFTSGWKVGGYARWNVTDLLSTECYGCGGPTELLFTVDSEENGETNIQVGRYGAFRLFVCRTCPGMPFRYNIQ